ncbi:MAG: imidazole glycerol phosphate synthase subunit HisH [Planctomycetota bacterium]
MLSIIDYGMGNLRSVQKAFERVGRQAVITSDPQQVAAATRLVLPGVGAYRDAVAALGERGLAEPIKEAIAAGKPLLGICLGLQLLFETSYEDGEHKGLGVLPGKVVKFDLPAELKVPHMGWNQIAFPEPQPPSASGRCPLFTGMDEDEHFYFVHSYYVEPGDPTDVATFTDYGRPFCSSVWRGNLFATQFHPEKSQAAGLRLLQNFAEL